MSDSIKIPAYDSSASRIEYCIVRCFYSIPVCIIGGIVAAVFGLVLFVLNFFNFITILFLGKRIESLYNLQVQLFEWNAKVGLYFYGSTDERPPITPC